MKKYTLYEATEGIAHDKCPQCNFETSWKEGDSWQEQDAEKEMDKHIDTVHKGDSMLDPYANEEGPKGMSKLDRHTKELRKGGWKPVQTSDKDKQWLEDHTYQEEGKATEEQEEQLPKGRTPQTPGEWDLYYASIEPDPNVDYTEEGGPGSGPTGKSYAPEPEQIARSGDPHYDPYKATPQRDRLQTNPALSRMTEEAPEDIDSDIFGKENGDKCENCEREEDFLNDDGLCEDCEREAGIDRMESMRDAYEFKPELQGKKVRITDGEHAGEIAVVTSVEIFGDSISVNLEGNNYYNIPEGQYEVIGESRAKEFEGGPEDYLDIGIDRWTGEPKEFDWKEDIDLMSKQELIDHIDISLPAEEYDYAVALLDSKFGGESYAKEIDDDGMNIWWDTNTGQRTKKLKTAGISKERIDDENLDFNNYGSQPEDVKKALKKSLGYESRAKEHAWQCDVCGKHLVDGKAANQHQQETGHYDMGFTATLSGDTKFDKLGEGYSNIVNILNEADFKEEDHPRDHGQFTDKGGGDSGGDKKETSKKEPSKAQKDHTQAMKDYDSDVKDYDEKMKEHKDKTQKYKDGLKEQSKLKKQFNKTDEIYMEGIQGGQWKSGGIDEIVKHMNDRKYGFASKKVTYNDVSKAIDKFEKMGLMGTNKHTNDAGYVTGRSYYASNRYMLMKHGPTQPREPVKPDKPVKRREEISQTKQDQLSKLTDRYARAERGSKKEEYKNQLNTKLDAVNKNRDFVKDGHYISDMRYDRKNDKESGIVTLMQPSKYDLTYPNKPTNDGYSSDYTPSDFKIGSDMVKVGDTIEFDDGDRGRTQVLVSSFSYDGDEWEGASINGYVTSSSNSNEHPTYQQKGHGDHRVSDASRIVSSSKTKMKSGESYAKEIATDFTRSVDIWGKLGQQQREDIIEMAAIETGDAYKWKEFNDDVIRKYNLQDRMKEDHWTDGEERYYADQYYAEKIYELGDGGLYKIEGAISNSIIKRLGQLGESYASEKNPTPQQWWEEEGWKEQDLFPWGGKPATNYSSNWSVLNDTEQQDITDRFNAMVDEEPTLFESKAKESKYKLTESYDNAASWWNDLGSEDRKFTFGGLFEVNYNAPELSASWDELPPNIQDEVEDYFGEKIFSQYHGEESYAKEDEDGWSDKDIADKLEGKIDWEWNKLPMTQRKQLAIDAGVDENSAQNLAYKSQDWQDVKFGMYGNLYDADLILTLLMSRGIVNESYAKEDAYGEFGLIGKWGKMTGEQQGELLDVDNVGWRSYSTLNPEEQKQVKSVLGEAMYGYGSATGRMSPAEHWKQGLDAYGDMGYDSKLASPMYDDFRGMSWSELPEDIKQAYMAKHGYADTTQTEAYKNVTKDVWEKAGTDLIMRMSMLEDSGFDAPESVNMWHNVSWDELLPEIQDALKKTNVSYAFESEDWKPHRDVDYGRNKPVKLEDEESVDDPEDIDILDRLLNNEEEEQEKGEDEEEDIALIAQLLDPEAGESKKKAIENNIWQSAGIDLNCPVCGLDFNSGRMMGDHLIVEHQWEDSDFEQFEEGRVNEAKKIRLEKKTSYADPRVGWMTGNSVYYDCPFCGKTIVSFQDSMGEMSGHILQNHGPAEHDKVYWGETEAETKVSPNSLLRDTDPLALPTGKNALDQTYGTSEPETPDGQDLTGKTIRRKSSYESITKILMGRGY